MHPLVTDIAQSQMSTEQLWSNYYQEKNEESLKGFLVNLPWDYPEQNRALAVINQYLTPLNYATRSTDIKNK
jgi:hypothetical protein